MSALVIDWEAFARDLRHCQIDRGVKSLRGLAQVTRISVPTLSRITNGGSCTVESFLTLIDWMDGDPYDYAKSNGKVFP